MRKASAGVCVKALSIHDAKLVLDRVRRESAAALCPPGLSHAGRAVFVHLVVREIGHLYESGHVRGLLEEHLDSIDPHCLEDSYTPTNKDDLGCGPR